MWPFTHCLHRCRHYCTPNRRLAWWSSTSICLRHHTHAWTEASQRFPTYIGQVMQKPTTSHIQKANNPLHIQTCQLCTFHSNTSNPCNAQCSWSIPPVTISTLISYVKYLSLIIFKIIPHPMTCLLPFHCKSSFHILFYTAYYRLLTIALLIHCLVVICRALVSIIPII
jgi:hypothetical protein